jgi:hypothetical protein
VAPKGADDGILILDFFAAMIFHPIFAAFLLLVFLAAAAFFAAFSAAAAFLFVPLGLS